MPESTLPPGDRYPVGFWGRLFFVAQDQAHGLELWTSDGTSEGTSLTADVWPGPQGSSPRDLTVAGDRLYFVADDGTHGSELWALADAGITVTPTSGIVTTEEGASASFTVVLDVRPVAPVGISLSVSKPTEARVFPDVVTFTPASWSVPQTIVVTGVDDGVADAMRHSRCARHWPPATTRPTPGSMPPTSRASTSTPSGTLTATA